jgi:hypothetical protein
MHHYRGSAAQASTTEVGAGSKAAVVALVAEPLAATTKNVDIAFNSRADFSIENVHYVHRFVSRISSDRTDDNKILTEYQVSAVSTAHERWFPPVADTLGNLDVPR